MCSKSKTRDFSDNIYLKTHTEKFAYTSFKRQKSFILIKDSLVLIPSNGMLMQSIYGVNNDRLFKTRRFVSPKKLTNMH